MVDRFRECDHEVYGWRAVDADGRPAGVWAARRWVRVACARRHCRAAICRQAWARKEAAVLEESFKSLPPTHFAVLHPTARAATPAAVAAVVARFTDRLTNLRRRGHQWVWYWAIEQSADRPPHVHLLLRTTHPKPGPVVLGAWDDAVTVVGGELITDILPLNVSTPSSCRPCRNPQNAARYCAKWWYDRDEDNPRRVTKRAPWLPGPEWAGRKVVQTCPGFLCEPRTTLWARVLDRWYPPDKPGVMALPEWPLAA